MTRHMDLKTDAGALRSAFVDNRPDEPPGLPADPGFVVDPWTGQKILVGDGAAASVSPALRSRFRSCSSCEEI